MLKLIKNKKANFCLRVYPPQEAEAIKDALFELAAHLEKLLPEKIDWFMRGSKADKENILILEIDYGLDFGKEEFAIEVTDHELKLKARTPIAMQHAVYFLLENTFGFRWLWPGKSGVVIPKLQDIELEEGITRHKPDWVWRRIWLGGAFYKEDDPLLAELKYGKVGPETMQELELWQKRNLLGGERLADGHRWSQICDPEKLGKTKPELFALVDGHRDCDYHDGKHLNQPCTTNPETIAIATDYIRNYFTSRPEMDGISITLNDGSGFCECKNCLEFDKQFSVQEKEEDEFDKTTNEYNGPGAGNCPKSLTDRMFAFANQIAEKVDIEFPDKKLIFLMYNAYRKPPQKIILHKNIIAQFCTRTWANNRPEVFESETKMLREFKDYTHHMGIYDYYINGKNGSLPRGFGRILDKSLNYYFEAGCRYFATQASLDFATAGFLYYFTAKKLWDIKIDFKTALADYCKTGFGKASEDIKKYIVAFHDCWENNPELSTLRYVEEMAAKLYPSKWREQREIELANALAKTPPESPERRRVGFIKKGLDYLNLYCDTAKAMLTIHNLGVPIFTTCFSTVKEWQDPIREKSADIDKEVLNKFIVLHKQYLKWFNNHRNDFIISAMWQNYQIYHQQSPMAWLADLLQDVLSGNTQPERIS